LVDSSDQESHKLLEMQQDELSKALFSDFQLAVEEEVSSSSDSE